MIGAKVQPYPCSIFEWGKNQQGCNLITISKKQLIMTLLPRTNARFTRQGLIAFGLRYDSKERNFTEEYLTGEDVTVSYNPESADMVYLQQEGNFIEFYLIESRFTGKSFEEIKNMQSAQRSIVGNAVPNNLQGRIDLTSHVERIVKGKEKSKDVNVKGVREAKKRAKEERHKDFMKEVQDEEPDRTDA